MIEESPGSEVIIIGGGVAGLSAALVLGRCCHNVLVLDAGLPRNRASRGMHGYLGLDGIDPAAFLETSREQVGQYGVHLVSAVVTELQLDEEVFSVSTREGSLYRAKYVLLAVGVVDELPKLPGLERFYARSIHHCPICDGWEHRGQRLAAYGITEEAVDLALDLKSWSDRVVLCTEGKFKPSAKQRQALAEAGISLFEEEIAELQGTGHQLEAIRGTNGGSVCCDALFFVSVTSTPTQFFKDLDCRRTESGLLDCTDDIQTSIPRLFAAGNTSDGLQLAIVAAAEGAKAGWAIHEAIMEG